jgi:SAM-dependent methyltransferase
VGLGLETVACPLCGEARFEPEFSQADLALGVPGRFHVARCPSCGLLYQNPRVRADRLAACYPPGYPPHARDPDLAAPPRLTPAVRALLAARLGYRHLAPERLGWRDRIEKVLRRARVEVQFPPFLGRGRLLDVGCATGRFLRLMAALGWETAGIEIDAAAADKARAVTPRVVVGDPAEVEFPPGSFDVVTAFHVLEHLPDPLRALANMLRWAGPDGLVVVEVPNVAGWGGRLFGRHWAGLELPRHLIQFAPATMGALAARAGGRVVRAVHKSKPRSLIRSLGFRLGAARGRPARWAGAAVAHPLGRGALKLLLELVLPLAEVSGRGEAVRYFIRPAAAEARGIMRPD